MANRGGKREGSGGRPAWKHGRTKPVRVPVALAEKILEIARVMDDMDLSEVDVLIQRLKAPQVIDLSGISIRFSKDGPAVYIADLMDAGYDIYPVPLRRVDRPSRSSLSALRKEISSTIENLKSLEEGG